MRIVSADEVHALLDFPTLIDALRTAHRGEPPRHHGRYIFGEPNPGAQPDYLIVLPAWAPGEGILCKMVTSFPLNKARHGLPTVQSLYVFLDARTGVPQAAIDGEAMIFRKTSADSALGASILARTDAEELLMIGAGGLAPFLVRAHLAARPGIRRVTVWNRTPANATRLAEALAAEGIPARATTDLDAALARADIVCAATMATEPHVKGALLKEGAHVDLVGSFTPEMREGDDDLLRRARIFVDHRQALGKSGEFLGPMARGVISAEDVVADLFELVQGRAKGRVSTSEITMMKNGGAAHLDYFVTKHLMDCLHERAVPAAN
jgi:ornithine cyclodeaminase